MDYLAYTLFQQNQKDEAEKIYRTILTLTENSKSSKDVEARYDALVTLGEIFAERKIYDKALAYYEEAKRVANRRPDAFFHVGNLKMLTICRPDH